MTRYAPATSSDYAAFAKRVGNGQNAVWTRLAIISLRPPPPAPVAVIFGERRVMRAEAPIAPQSTANARFSRDTCTMAPMVEVVPPLSLAIGLQATANWVYA